MDRSYNLRATLLLGEDGREWVYALDEPFEAEDNIQAMIYAHDILDALLSGGIEEYPDAFVHDITDWIVECVDENGIGTDVIEGKE